jgi:SPP1 family predicted phage head-tail adaptor
VKKERYNMDRRLLVQYPVTTRSATGAEAVTWENWRTIWAYVEYPKMGNGEEISTDQEQITRRVRFVIRWTGEIQEKWRFVFLGDTLDILRIAPLGGRQEYEDITAEIRK